MAFNRRRVISLTLFLTLVAMPVSALIAHAMHGVRGSHHIWIHIHVICGVLFTVAGIFHIVYNWRTLKHYLAGKK